MYLPLIGPTLMRWRQLKALLAVQVLPLSFADWVANQVDVLEVAC